MGITIVLIDDSRLFREGLRRIFEDSPFEVKFEASTLDVFESHVGSAETLMPAPELILIDTRQVGQALLEQLKNLRGLFPDSRLVILTGHMQLNRLAIVLAAGADGYLLKDLSGEALLQSLRLVLLGEKVFPTDLAQILVNDRIVADGNFTSDDHATEDLDLSQRERQLLQCLANGFPNKVIANTLEITESTVKGHLKTLLRKINVQNRTQAAVWALNHGVGIDVSNLQCHGDGISNEASHPDDDGYVEAETNESRRSTPDDREGSFARVAAGGGVQRT